MTSCTFSGNSTLYGIAAVARDSHAQQRAAHV